MTNNFRQERRPNKGPEGAPSLTRRELGLWGLGSAFALALPLQAADGALDVGNRKQLFFDSKFIESSSGVTHTVNPPSRTGDVLLTADQPWEEGLFVGSYCSVLKEDGKIRVWYNLLEKEHRPNENPDFMCVAYAESKDGIHFEKPILGLVEYKGSKQNNFVMPHDPTKLAQGGGSVSYDQNPNCPAAERYKSWQKIYPKRGSGLRGPYGIFVSPDGLRWKLSEKPVTGLRAADTQPTWFWDKRIQRYVGYSREWVIFSGEQQIRMASYNESDDMFAWDSPQIVLEPDEADFTGNLRPQVDFANMTVRGERLIERADAASVRRPTDGRSTARPNLATDGAGQLPDQVPDPGAPMDIYGPGVSLYDEADTTYLSLYSAFHHWGAQSRPDTADVGLALSRDGRNFPRPTDRQPFLRLGPEGAFDSRWIWAMPRPVRMGDELWIYYLGTNKRHGGVSDIPESQVKTAVSRAVMRLDGFVSADFAYTGGTLMTPLLRFQGSRLELNLDTSSGGVGRVAILDERGAPISGYSFLEADELIGNNVRTSVSWKGKTDLSPLQDKPVRLLFRMRSAKLYAFQFV